jgi:hypothetical protein
MNKRRDNRSEDVFHYEHLRVIFCLCIQMRAFQVFVCVVCKNTVPVVSTPTPFTISRLLVRALSVKGPVFSEMCRCNEN